MNRPTPQKSLKLVLHRKRIGTRRTTKSKIIFIVYFNRLVNCTPLINLGSRHNTPSVNPLPTKNIK